MQRTVTGLGYDLVDLERSGGGLLRVTIDRVPGHAYPTGESEAVTVEDCEAVTRQLQYVLEVEGCDYARLEVSSPGVDRPLKTAADYARFAGQAVDLTLRLPFQGRKRFRGTLVPREDDGWRLVLTPPEPAPARGAKGRKPASPGARSAAAAQAAKTAAAAGGPEAAALQALDFSLDEVREARLVPVLDFKGRKAAEPQRFDGDRKE